MGRLGYLIARPIVDEASQLSRQGPAMIKQINDIVNTVRTQLASTASSSAATVSAARSAATSPAGWPGVLLNVVTSTVTILLDILVTLVVAFWMLKDGEQLRGGIVNLLPGRLRSEANFAFDAFGVVVGGYVRGQLFMAAIIGVMAGLGCWSSACPSPSWSRSPRRRSSSSRWSARSSAALSPSCWPSPRARSRRCWALLLFIVIHIIEGYLLAPRIQARFVRLHPLVTILALFAGIEPAASSGPSWRCPWPA